MKRFLGMILGFAFGAGLAYGGSIGGIVGNGNNSMLIYNPSNHSLMIPDWLDEYFVITKRDVNSSSDFKIYSMKPRDFDRIQDVADSNEYVNVKGENNSNRSYRVRSGDEMDKVELFDRRIEMRNSTTR